MTEQRYLAAVPGRVAARRCVATPTLCFPRELFEDVLLPEIKCGCVCLGSDHARPVQPNPCDWFMRLSVAAPFTADPFLSKCPLSRTSRRSHAMVDLQSRPDRTGAIVNFLRDPRYACGGGRSLFLPASRRCQAGSCISGNYGC